MAGFVNVDGFCRALFSAPPLSLAPVCARSGVQRRLSVDELEEELARCPVASAPAPAYLVGCGPGDPGLLTLHAWSTIRNATMVLHDRLVSDQVLDLVSTSALKVPVGKTGGDHSVPIQQIHDLLARCAQAGKTVVRLQGGDPSIFGRTGPELKYLADRQIPVVVVPGVNTASAIAADLQIPLTDLERARSLSFVSFHDLDYFNTSKISSDATYVLFMSLKHLEDAAELLMAGGLSRDVPAVAVERGTLPHQRSVFATLSKLPEKVQALELRSPCLIVVGSIVELSVLWHVRD